MRTPTLFLVSCVCGLLLRNARAADPQPNVTALRQLAVIPAAVHLPDARSRQQLIVTAVDGNGYVHDVTRDIVFEAADTQVASVDKAGVVRPGKAGITRVRARLSTTSAEVQITVGDLQKSQPISFTNEVMAVLGKAGCNSGACHGHNSGKGGFKLSLRGHDPAADHKTLVHPDFGRVELKDPELSKILLKPTAQTSHKGGKRFEVDSDSYRILKRWLAEGARADMNQAVRLQRLEVLPVVRTMPRAGQQQQLVVRAHFAGGSVRDVTDQAIYELFNEGVIEVSPRGLVSGKREGEAAVFVRFLGQMGLSRCIVIQHKPDFAWSNPPANNFIDSHVFSKLKAIQVWPSALSSDTEFLRRVHFDTVGLPPTPDQVRAFVADQRPDKRAHKIDELLGQEDFGEVWAMYWLELSGTTESGASARFKGMWLLSFWLRNAINRNLPYDQFVRALVAAKGSSIDNAAVTYSLNRLPKQEMIPQLFLGIRMECAQCHDHPFDVVKQSDYQALGEFFQDLGHKEMARDFWGLETHRFVNPDKFLPWEKGKKTKLRMPDGATVEAPVQRDRRDVLVDWMFGPGQKQTARALVNRVWGKLLGRGIVDPVDDIRFSNPAVNEALLNALADDFIAQRWDFKNLVRTILNSRSYQLSSIANDVNAHEESNFSHARLKRLTAEQLLDAVAMVTGISEDQLGMPGLRAVQFPYAGASRFLTLFGRPQQRMSPCECIRSHEATLPQVMHLLNGDTISKRLGGDGSTLKHLLASAKTDDQLVEDIYLTVLSRPPSARERQFAKGYVRDSQDRTEGAEDLMWALLTSQEFLFNH